MSASPAPKFTTTQWLIVIIAAIGFAFDIYELLVWPLVGRPALEQLLGVDQFSESGNRAILTWFSYIMYGSAISGGIFGLLGGYLTDWFGRRRILTFSILLYAFSALASGFAWSAESLLIFRCLTFIGVCIEFVAATAWLAELFDNPKQREAVLGYTQAFSSVGGLMVTGVFLFCNHFAESFPPIFGAHDAWRYTLISGVIPAIPLIFIRPFLPESPVWEAKRKAGTITRPSFGLLFSPELRRTTIVTAILMMCGYGVAFGAIQLLPQIVPGLVKGAGTINPLRVAIEEAKTNGIESPKVKGMLEKIKVKDVKSVDDLRNRARDLFKSTQVTVSKVQLWQELGGLVGRFVLAYLAVVIISRRKLLRLFQIPALIITPLVFFYFATGRAGDDYSLTGLQIGIFVAAFFVVGQLSFWGNYLPMVYPVKLRGTGESFAANVGGRMFGTGGNPLALLVILPLLEGAITGFSPPQMTAHAAALTALIFCLLAVIVTFFLPEPLQQKEGEEHGA